MHAADGDGRRARAVAGALRGMAARPDRTADLAADRRADARPGRGRRRDHPARRGRARWPRRCPNARLVDHPRRRPPRPAREPRARRTRRSSSSSRRSADLESTRPARLGEGVVRCAARGRRRAIIPRPATGRSGPARSRPDGRARCRRDQPLIATPAGLDGAGRPPPRRPAGSPSTPSSSRRRRSSRSSA